MSSLQSGEDIFVQVTKYWEKVLVNIDFYNYLCYNKNEPITEKEGSGICIDQFDKENRK
jgi:hypothetical protein